MSRVPSEEVHLEKKRQGEGYEIAEEEEPKRQKVEDEDEDMDEEQVEKMRQGEGCEIEEEEEEEEEEPNPQKVEREDEEQLEKKRQGEGCEIADEEEPKLQKVEDEDEHMDEKQLEDKWQGEGCEIAEENLKPQEVDDFNLGDSDNEDCESEEIVGSGIDNYETTVLHDVQGYMCDKERLCNIYQHECTFGSPLFEIFKVKLVHNGNNNIKGMLGHLYGEIAIPMTSGNPNRPTSYYYVKMEDRMPITLTPVKHFILPLSGPDAGRPPITYFPRHLIANLAFNFDSKDLGKDSCSHVYDDGDGIHTFKIRGYVCSSEFFSGMDPMSDCWIFRHLLTHSPCDPIKVVVNYGIYFGAWATVNVEMAKKGVSGFYGLIFARSCLFCSRFRLLSISSDQKRVIQTSESPHLIPIDLTRKVVSVPSNSSLIIGAVLYDQDGNQIVKDKTIFPAKEDGHAEEFIGRSVIKIKVDWDAYPTRSDKQFCKLGNGIVDPPQFV